MAGRDPVVVVGLGLATPVGAGAAQACAAMRAGIARFAETSRYSCSKLDGAGLEPARVSRARAAPEGASGGDRLAALALAALGEAVKDAGLTRADLARARLHLALPQASRPGGALDPLSFAADLCRRADLPDFLEVTGSHAGHSGFAEAAVAAVHRLAGDREGLAIVLCVDSLLDRPTLEWLDARGRLKCERSPEGVIAGEAAAALVLRLGSRAAGRARGRLEAVTTDEERATVFSDQACTGKGLTRAMRRMAERLSQPPRPPWVLSDLNGERYRGQEWGYVVTRMHEMLADLRHTWYVADTIGDVGAAVGGVLAARALEAFARGYAPAEIGLVLMSSDDGGRGVVGIGAPPPEE